MKRLASNKYVVRYYDSNAQKLDNGSYEVLLLMEYCPNGSLLDFMNRHLKTKLTVDQIVKIMYQISIAISGMHYLKLIHRDLKIENVLIDSNNNFKLADFGSTSEFLPPPRNQEEFHRLANDILHNTTPQYRAPEMIDLYKNLPIDNKSDIWALGVFLYKLMYYTTPFEAQGELAILHGFFQFSQIPKYPSRLKNLVIIMLQVNPSFRPNIYQVICEVCDLLGKKNSAEDFYGLGPYNYEEYAIYQQQLQLQQQLQQQQLMEQKAIEQQRTINQQQTKSRSRTVSPLPAKNPLGADDFNPDEHESDSPYTYQSQELTRSSETSRTNLNTYLAEPDDDEDVAEKTGDKSGNESPDLSNVAERFPAFEDFDPVIKTGTTAAATTTGNSQLSSISKISRSVVSSDEYAENKSKPPVSTIIPPEHTTKSNESSLNLGTKLSKTEAWLTPVNGPVSTIKVDGVFHKGAEEDVNEWGKLKDDDDDDGNVVDDDDDLDNLDAPDDTKSLLLNESVDEDEDLENIENENGTQSPQETEPVEERDGSTISNRNSERIYDRDSQIDVGRDLVAQGFNRKHWSNPFPTSSPSTTVAASSSVQVIQGKTPERNPWAQYTKLQQTQNPNSQISITPTSRQLQPIQGQQISSSQQVSSFQPQMFQNVVYGSPYVNAIPSGQNIPPKPQSYLSPNFSYSSSMNQKIPTAKYKNPILESPSIKITNNDTNLVNIPQSNEKLLGQRKFNLDLLELELDGKTKDKGHLSSSSMVESSHVKDDLPSHRKKSGSELVVEELSITPRSSFIEARRSGEISRLNLDLEELDLDENVIENDTGNDNRIPRRSLSMKRNTASKKNSKRARSIGTSRKSEDGKHSFLGFNI